MLRPPDADAAAAIVASMIHAWTNDYFPSREGEGESTAGAYKGKKKEPGERELFLPSVQKYASRTRTYNVPGEFIFGRKARVH